MPTGRLLLQTSALNKIICRNAFTAKPTDTSKPNMLRVGITLGSAAFLWGLLFIQHSNDVKEYKKINGLE